MAPIAVSAERDTSRLEALTTAFDDTIRFYLNGTRVVLDEIDPEVTLLEYLRGIGLTGTKLFVCGHIRHPFPPYVLTQMTDPLPVAAQKEAAAPAPSSSPSSTPPPSASTTPALMPASPRWLASTASMSSPSRASGMSSPRTPPRSASQRAMAPSAASAPLASS